MDALQATARRVQARVLVRLSAMHAVGGLVVFGYLQQVYPASEAFATPWLNDFVLVALTEAVLAPIAWFWVRRHYRRTAAWALEGRTPTADERRQILAEPWRMAARPFVLWLAATAFIVTGAYIRDAYGPAELADVAQVMLIGGSATCAITYLIIEQTYRPLFATALAGAAPARPASLGVRPRLLLGWAVSSGVPLLGLALAPVRQTGASLFAVGALAIIGFVGGLFTTLVAANSIAEPLDSVRRALARVAAGDLSTDLVVDDGSEVGQLQAGFNQMAAGLRERHELQDLFSRHVGQEVAAQALERGVGLGGEQRQASVIFVDLIGSTAMAEVLPPTEVVATLNAFFQAVVDAVTEEGGWVNKFEGDGALCVFGVPGEATDHQRRALRAARLVHQRLREARVHHPGLDAGIGVSSGTVVAGNVGTEERFEYTVIGRAVNEAARLTELAKQRRGRVLASATAVRASGDERARWADRGQVGLRGQKVPTDVCEPVTAPVTAPVTEPVTTRG